MRISDWSSDVALPICKRFSPRAVSVVAQTAEVGWIKPRTRSILARQSRFSARQTDLSCRFRSAWAWIVVMRMTEAFDDGGWRQRAEDRREGKDGVSTCVYRGWQYH